MKPFSMSVVLTILSFTRSAAMRKIIDPDEKSVRSTAKDHFNNFADGVGGFVGGVIPQRSYTCKQDLNDKEVDRWVSVSPDFGTTTKVRQWLNYHEWGSWLEQQLGWAEHQPSPFSFDPYVLRTSDAYSGRLLLKTIRIPAGGSGDPCIATYQARCGDGGMQLLKSETCGQGSPSTESLNFGTFSPTYSFCTKEAVKPSYINWYGKPSQDVFVIDSDGEAQAVKMGNCVKISTLDATAGIDLEDLDSDMMGLGFQNLAANASKLEHVLTELNQTLIGIAQGIAATAGTVIEAGDDVVTVGKQIDKDLFNGSKAAGTTSVKWIKKLALDSLVDTCLCCDAESYATDESLSKHCKVAYTLGGTNKSQWLEYSAKASAGTVYNLAQTAGGWLVPFLGGNIVRESHKKACSYTCSLRKPQLYEAYAVGKVRKVPGLALKTWFIPNPASFYSSAASGVGEEVGEAVVEGAANNAANGVITGAVS